MDITLDWEPQRVIWIAIGLSAVGVLLCLAILAVVRRRRRQTLIPNDGFVDSPRVGSLTAGARPLNVMSTLGLMAATMIAVSAFSRIRIALAAALAAGIVALIPRVRWALGVAAAAALMVSRLGHRPNLAWLALALFGLALVAAAVSDRDTADPTAT